MTTTKSKHTPTVNEVLTELAGVLHRVPEEHRDVIIRAVNSHTEMLSALKRAELIVQQLDQEAHGLINCDVLAAIRGAISKAEGNQ